MISTFNSRSTNLMLKLKILYELSEYERQIKLQTKQQVYEMYEKKLQLLL